MASEWLWIRLGDHCLKIGSGATPKGGSESYLSDGPFALIRSQNVYNDGFKPEGLAFISQEQAQKLDGVAIRENDVLLNITGDSVARVCLAPKEWLPARVNQHVSIIRPEPAKLDPRFLRYFLASQDQQHRMLGLASSGATRNALTKGMIEDFQVPCPPLNEQREIADILSSLDTKIELNRCLNATLEAMAQALFKSWFVDFDPVKAKAEGRVPEGMGAATAALFPAEFEEGDLGVMPEGGSVKELSECVTLHTRSIQPVSTPDQLYAHFSIPAFDDRRLPVVEQGTNIQSGKYIIQRNSVLVSKLNPNTPRVWLPKTHRDLVSVCSTEFMQFVPHDEAARAFLYCLMKSEAALNTVRATVTGTTGSRQRAQPQQVMKARFVWPSGSLIQAFAQIALPLLERIASNLEESEWLAASRDALLPRLISGQLRIPDAEQLTAAL